MNDPWIAPSILAADFARLGDEVASVLEAGADIIHFDVMDNHYVPNLTVGPMVLSALRKFGIKSMMDVHLMVNPVDRLIGDFVEAGADMITFHPEASDHVDRSLSLIKSSGVKCGLALNPAGFRASPHLTPEDLIKESERSTWSDASGWKVIISAPASTKSPINRSTGLTMRWTSIIDLIPNFLSALSTIGPTVKLGT